jgi:hypothetical protein
MTMWDLARSLEPHVEGPIIFNYFGYSGSESRDQQSLLSPPNQSALSSPATAARRHIAQPHLAFPRAARRQCGKVEVTARDARNCRHESLAPLESVVILRGINSEGQASILSRNS